MYMLNLLWMVDNYWWPLYHNTWSNIILFPSSISLFSSISCRFTATCHVFYSDICVACRCHRAIFFKWGTFGVISIYFRLFALFWKNKYIFQYQSLFFAPYMYKMTCDSKRFIYKWHTLHFQLKHILSFRCW
jgi:hypothetical protein